MEVRSLVREALVRLTRIVNVRPGETFGVGWETSGSALCEVGAKRVKSKGLNGLHVNLIDLPQDSSEPLLHVTVAEVGWVNLDNYGNRPVTVQLPSTEEGRFMFVASLSDIAFNGTHKKPQNGLVELQPGEAISTRQEGSKYSARWQNGGKEAILTFRNKLNYSTQQPAVDITYNLK